MTEDTIAICPRCGYGPQSLDCSACDGLGIVQTDSMFWDAVIEQMESDGADKWLASLEEGNYGIQV